MSFSTKQDVFIYQKGNSILPSGTFQQTTRTRNIDTLYFDLESSLKIDSVIYHNAFVNFIQPIENSFWILLPQQISIGTTKLKQYANGMHKCLYVDFEIQRIIAA